MILRQRLLRLLPRGEAGWLLRSGSGLGGMRIVNMAVGLATTVLLARIMGAEGYGVYTFALGWVFILGMPLQMGLPTLVMRQVAIYRSNADRGRLRGIVRWSFRLIGVGAVLVGLVGGAVVAYLAAAGQWPTTFSLLLVGSAFMLLCLLALLALYRSIISGFENVVVANVPDTLVRPVLFLLAIVAVTPFLVQDAGTVMMLHAAAALGAALLAWSMAARRLREIKGGAPQHVLIENRVWFASLWPMTIMSGAAMINSRMDIAMLGIITGLTGVAVYDVGTKVAGLMIITQALLNAAIAPRIARIYARGDREKVQALMVQACRLSFIPSAILLVGIWLAGPVLLPALLGPGFDEAYAVALIVAVGFLFNTGVGAVGVLLNMSGHERVMAKVVTASAVMNVVINAILIPAYGANGAAVATTLTMLFVQTFLWWKALALTGIRGDLLAFGQPTKGIASAADKIS